MYVSSQSPYYDDYNETKKFYTFHIVLLIFKLLNIL